MVKQQYYCDYGKISSRNGVVYLHCTKINDACGFQRFCTNDQCIKHTNNFVNCKYRKGIDDMGKKKNRKSDKPIQENALTKKISEPIKLESQGDDMRTTKRMKVILVHPNYFIVDNGGYAKRIQGKTDLKAGDWYIMDIEPEAKKEVEEVKEIIKEEKIEEVVEQVEEIPLVEVEMIEEE